MNKNMVYSSKNEFTHSVFGRIHRGFIAQGPPVHWIWPSKNSWFTHCHQTSSCQNAPLCVVDAREITTWLKLLGLKLVIRDFHTATAASRCGGTVATAISGSATIAGVKRVKSMILEFPGDWTGLNYSWFALKRLLWAGAYHQCQPTVQPL